MKGNSGSFRQSLANVFAYAYKTLALYFFFVFGLRLLTRDCGWINWFMVFLILSCPIALGLVFRRLATRA